jgi:hypothetical protein
MRPKAWKNTNKRAAGIAIIFSITLTKCGDLSRKQIRPMESFCTPSSFFDPFGNEPTHGPCAECGEVKDYGDLTNVGTIVFERYLCSDCLELEPEEGED